MSFNLVLSNLNVVQTHTDFTMEMMSGKYTPLEILALYKRRYVDPYAPKPLQGKDARNPYLIKQHAEDVRQHYEHYEKLLKYLQDNPQARWTYR